jgi:Tol biopolymer transport system component
MPLPFAPARRALALFAASALLTLIPAAARAATPTTTRASVSSTSAEADNSSSDPTVSADGRYVVFASYASNLVAGDTNGSLDIFVRDRQTGQTTRVDVGPAGEQANGSQPTMTPDARYVAFVSTQPAALVPGTTATGTQLFLLDRSTGALRMLPSPPAGFTGPAAPRIDDDGGRIVYRASGGGVNGAFVVDTASGTTTRADALPDGTPGNGGDGFEAVDPAISGDGNWVAFTTDSTNLVAPDTNGFRDVIARDLRSGAFTRVSTSSSNGESNLHSSTPALDRDGCLIAFYSTASNLVQGDSGGVSKTYVRDRCAGQTEYASLSNAGVSGGSATPIQISEDGCRIVFPASSAIVSPAPGSGNGAVVRDRCAGTTSRVDLSTSGDPGTGSVTQVSISGGTGRYVAFTTSAANLVAGDANGTADVFVRDLATNTVPVAALSATASGLTVAADATGSYDPDGFNTTATISYGDGSAPQPGFHGTHAFAHAGTYGVTATITDSDGASTTRTVAVTVADTGGGAGGGGGGGGASLLLPPTGTTPLKLVMDRLSLSPSRFAVVASGRKPDARHGSELTLRLSAPATVTLRFQRARTGHRSRGKCSTSAHRGSRCTIYTDAGTLTKSLPAGTSTIVLTGRVGSHALATARHRLLVTARDAAGDTATASALSLTIVRAPKTKSTNKKKA